MVRLNKIYTRTGDAGETGLADGSRISKADPRLAAIGDVDEANSAIGAGPARASKARRRARCSSRIQNELFDLGADLATPGEDFAPDGMALRIVPGQIDRLEREIDEMNEDLEPLRSFILPGGGRRLGRAPSRPGGGAAGRARRGRGQASAFNPLALTYLNRLSDHLFVLARWVARDAGGDILWQPGATRES